MLDKMRTLLTISVLESIPVPTPTPAITFGSNFLQNCSNFKKNLSSFRETLFGYPL